MLQTEYDFTLPLGYVDQDGALHREGTMRLATAADEILPLKDPRVRGNDAYLIVILLARVIERLGSVPQVTPKVIEGLFAADLAFLQDLYNRINRVSWRDDETTGVPASQRDASLEAIGVGES
jgi:hypothetical protein